MSSKKNLSEGASDQPAGADATAIIAEQNAQLRARLAEYERKEQEAASVREPEHVTKKGYEVPENELLSVHASIEQPRFDRNSGKRLSKPTIQKWDPRGWLMFLDNHERQGWTIKEVLHLPEGSLSLQDWKKQQAAQNKEGKVVVTPR